MCRIARGSVRVKDCYQKIDDKKASFQAVEKLVKTPQEWAHRGVLAKNNFLRRLPVRTSAGFQWCVGCLSVVIKPLARDFRPPIAQHVAMHSAVSLSLLQLRRVCGQLVHGRHVGLLGSLRLTAGRESREQQQRCDSLHSSISSWGAGSGGDTGLTSSGYSMACTLSMNRANTFDARLSRRRRYVVSIDDRPAKGRATTPDSRHIRMREIPASLKAKPPSSSARTKQHARQSAVLSQSDAKRN